MKKYFKQAMVVACAVGLAACSQQPATSDAATTAAPPEAADTAAPAVALPAPPVVQDPNFVELPFDSTSNYAVNIAVGESVSAEAGAPRDGAVSSVEVQVGNYGNASKGDFTLQLCQGSRCGQGSADFASSTNNDDFLIPLSSPFEVKAAEGPLTFKFSRQAGSELAAVWSYPATVPTSTLTVPNGDKVSRTLKIGLHFVP